MADERPFSSGVWIDGLLTALLMGCAVNSVMAMATNDSSFGFVVGAIPGALLLLLYIPLNKNVRPLALGKWERHSDRA